MENQIKVSDLEAIAKARCNERFYRRHPYIMVALSSVGLFGIIGFILLAVGTGIYSESESVDCCSGLIISGGVLMGISLIVFLATTFVESEKRTKFKESFVQYYVDKKEFLDTD